MHKSGGVIGQCAKVAKIVLTISFCTDNIWSRKYIQICKPLKLNIETEKGCCRMTDTVRIHVGRPFEFSRRHRFGVPS